MLRQAPITPFKSLPSHGGRGTFESVKRKYAGRCAVRHRSRRKGGTGHRAVRTSNQHLSDRGLGSNSAIGNVADTGIGD